VGDRLHDKIAIVTGAASGLGKAQAERFVEEGARVPHSRRRRGLRSIAGL
jgi:NAD(P)-dependent dehydrogenase (short-subunit alcohol dehydrogenase family)